MSVQLQQSCKNHGEREAVAKCPTCTEPFCRECITEHDYQMICAGCLAELTRPEEKARRRWLPIGAVVQLALSLVLVFLIFYFMAECLMLIPSEFHEGSAWSDF